ncbi:hypothetical protein PAMP_014502 [Pampus punctatissimus]
MSEATSNFSEYALQAKITLYDLESLSLVLDTLPLLIHSMTEIISINATTVCLSDATGYQCRCEENFAWSYNNCIKHGACDAINGHTCGCINDLPAEDKFCQLNTSRAGTESLTFTPAEVFFGEQVTVTCGPPPPNLNLGTDWTAEWTCDGKSVLQDNEHRFSKQNGVAMLTMSKTFNTDNGLYECKLKRGKSVFRQKSKGILTLKETPLIQVTPIRRKVKCDVGKRVLVRCSVQSPYKVKFKDTSAADFDCVNDTDFGDGAHGDKAVAPCEKDNVGEKTAVCSKNGEWLDRRDNCILRQVQELLGQSEFLNSNSLPGFLEQLSSVAVNFTKDVVSSPNNINTIVQILSNVANASSSLLITISKTSMEDVLLTAGILTTDEAKDSWTFLNTNASRTNSVTRSRSSKAESTSSTLLLSLETITKALINGSFAIETPSILLNKTTFTGTFNADFNSTVVIDIPDGGSNNITVITFASMDNVLLARDKNNATINNVINGRVVLVQSSDAINNVSFTFDIINKTLENMQCVYWNFSLFNGLGGWDNEGCELVSNTTGTVTCNCNHLTSFSILMSPNSPDDVALTTLTYVGVGVSMGSLVICLIIEAVIWKKIRMNNTLYLRHVSIVNIAVSLLIANIWFIIGAAISKAKEENQPACTAAAFFIHFFYLSLFFWMLATSLLLLYRTLSVFDSGLSKKSMLAVGFSLGYGAPLIIAIITIAVTTPNQVYIQRPQGRVCWLNWKESKAQLAFVIPALLIVLINLVIMLVVIFKMLRRRAVAAQADERHDVVVIARSMAVLTPIFGLTWGLGIATMTLKVLIIHILFALFNSLQMVIMCRPVHPVDLTPSTLDLCRQIKVSHNDNQIQVFAAEDVHVAELMVESNLTLDVEIILSALNAKTDLIVIDANGVSHTVTFLSKEVIAECLIVGPDSECNCSDGYVWSNNVCYNLDCCSETTCRQNVSYITPLCIAKVHGTYECGFTSGSIRHTAQIYLSVALLPDEIILETNPSTVDCSTGVESVQVDVNATIPKSTESFEVAWFYRDEGPHTNIVYKKGVAFCSEDTQDLWPKTPSDSTVIKRTCEQNKIGYKSRTCKGSTWQQVFDNCVNEELNNVLNKADHFQMGLGATDEGAMVIFEGLKNTSTSDSDNSMADIRASIGVLAVMSKASENFALQENIYPDFVNAASSMLNKTWEKDNTSVIQNMSSNYLAAVEGLVKNIKVNNTNGFIAENLDFKFCSSGQCNISVFDIEVNMNTTSGNIMKTVAVKNLMNKLGNNFPKTETTDYLVSATLVPSNNSSLEIRLSFPKYQLTARTPLCVFWNTVKKEWSNEGCIVKTNDENRTLCECNHLTSFSILMSRGDVSNSHLDNITKVGMYMSICSLVIFLIIESLVWSAVVKTNLSHLRHTAMVNIAVFLLLADCCFLASMNPQTLSDTWCLVLTLCKHLFFLVMFCWMLCLSAMLVHQLIFVFSPLRKRVFMFLSSITGYVCPILIVGSSYVYCKYTNKPYYNEKCWLVYERLLVGSMHAFLLPVGIIIFTNLFSMAVVILTLMKTTVPDGSKTDDKDTAKSILKVVVFLTPVFGVTWVIGFFLLVLEDHNSIVYAIANYSFTILNAFQVI